MNIAKQHESFTLTDSTDTFEMHGNVTYEVSGGLNIHFRIFNFDDEDLLICSYSKYPDTAQVTFSISASDENRDELTPYVNAVVAYVLEQLK